ncbi:RNA exonuclease 4-like isoform X1 [Vespa mandarinia]|uniref:RNA exonuclease 4-like isoform X1 n=2 Tax=Vespa mandarinia TaxID=7446 RepID=UPI00161611DB|nr:RNA exonuclease 4-like isoform X1 [Vespa mandarinia]
MISFILTVVILVFIYTILTKSKLKIFTNLDFNQLVSTKDQNQNMEDQHTLCKRDKFKERRLEENAAYIKPITKRSESGCNWETYKDVVYKEESSYDKKKNNPAKKFSNKYLKSKKLNNVPLLETGNTMNQDRKFNHTMDENKTKITKLVAMDCEMVGIGDGSESMIARVSIVNKFGYCLYDKYVKPREKVQDYRTAVSGIYPHHLKNGEEFFIVQKEVADILRGRILVGHALKNDLAVLFLSHPWKNLRDTSRYKPFKQITKANTPSLKRLALELLGIEIQVGEHNSVEDARVAMQLYMQYKAKWESEIYSKR